MFEHGKRHAGASAGPRTHRQTETPEVASAGFPTFPFAYKTNSREPGGASKAPARATRFSRGPSTEAAQILGRAASSHQ